MRMSSAKENESGHMWEEGHRRLFTMVSTTVALVIAVAAVPPVISFASEDNESGIELVSDAQDDEAEVIVSEEANREVFEQTAGANGGLEKDDTNEIASEVGVELTAMASNVASGKWGTCNWEIDSGGTLTVHPGTGVDNTPEFEWDLPASPWSKWSDKITRVSIKRENGKRVIAPADCGFLFTCFRNLISADLSGLDTSKVTNMESLFRECASLVSVNTTGLDTSRVRDMSCMFADCPKLSTVDVSGWDTSEVTDTGSMFLNCFKLNRLDASNWNTSRVEYMKAMFMGCWSLTSLDISGWNTSNVWGFDYMFENCSFDTLDFSNWDMSKAEQCYDMFAGCTLREMTVGKKFSFEDDADVPSSRAPEGKWWSVSAGRWLTRAQVAKRNGIADTYRSQSTAFSDVNDKTAHEDDILWLSEQGISTGWTNYTGKEFRPLSNVKRADMAAFLFRLAKKWNVLGAADSWVPKSTTKNRFKDVSESTAHAQAIWWMAENGISAGWDLGGGKAEFRPLADVKRADLAAFLGRLATKAGRAGVMDVDKKAFLDVTASVDHSDEIWWMATNAISTGWEVTGGKEFRPFRSVKRADMAAFLHRMDGVR